MRLALVGFVSSVMSLLFACSSSEQRDATPSPGGSSGSGAAAGATNGGTQNGGGSTSNAGKPSTAGAGGGASTGCAFAKDDPTPVEPQRAIATRIVLLYDPALDDPEKVAAWSDFTEACGSNAVTIDGITGRPPWGECIAKHYVDNVNGAFGALIGSTSPLFEFESFTAQPNAALARDVDRRALAQAVKPLAENDKLNVFVVLDLASIDGGVADVSQAYPSKFSGLSVVVRADLPWSSLAHEVGHAVGFPHTSGFQVEPTAEYPCCGVQAVATTYSPMCSEPDANIMCTGGGVTFDSCEHGLFLKRIAACWLSGGGGISCGEDTCMVRPDYDKQPTAWCQVDGAQLSCACGMGSKTYTAVDCKDADAKNAAACTRGTECDVFAASACPTAQACYPALGETSECLPSGTTPAGGACTAPNNCAPGAVCRQNVCATICDTAATDSATKCPDTCSSLVGWSEHIWICTP